MVILLGEEVSEFVDAKSYNGYAKAIIKDSQWLTNPNFPGNYRPPIYPMFIATIYKIFGINNVLAVYIFQAIISTITCFYIYKFAQKLFDNKVALLSMICSGFYLFYIFYTTMLVRETLVFFFIVIFFYYIYLYMTNNKFIKLYIILSALFYSLLIHTDPRYLFYLPFIFILFIIYNSYISGINRYLIFISIVIFLMFPWIIRNYICYDGLVIINTRGIDLRVKSKRNNKMATYKRNVFYFGTINSTNNLDYPKKNERNLIKLGQNPNNRSNDELIAIRNDKYPATSYFHRKLYNFIELWKPFDFTRSYRPFPDARFNGVWSIKHNLTSIACYGILLPFMFFGIYFLIKKKDNVIYILMLPLFVQTLLHILEHARNRYRFPIDFIIIILACYGIMVFSVFIKNKIQVGR